MIFIWSCLLPFSLDLYYYLVGSTFSCSTSGLVCSILRLLRCLFVLGLQLAHDASALAHHVRIQHVGTRDIDGQDRIESPFVDLAQLLLRGFRGQPHEHALAGDAERIQDEEGVVAQPREGLGLPVHGEQGNKVRVADDLGDGPGDEHGGVEGRLEGQVREVVDDAPDEEEAGGDLHDGREDGGAHNACDDKEG